MENMKELLIGEHTFKYQIYNFEGKYYTIFYYGEEYINKYKQFGFFGKEIIEKTSKFAFDIDFWMNDPKIKDDDMKKAIMDKYTEWVKYNTRMENLEKGKLF